MSEFKNEYSIQENIVNISMRAAELLKDRKIQRDDMDGHAGLTQTIVQLAKQFEREHADEDWNLPFSPDYWEEIDKFAEAQLIERYGMEPPENTVKLWARVGVTLEVSQSTYEILKTGDRIMLQDVLDGNVGQVRLDGETYFPDIEQNAGLEDMEFDLPVSRVKQPEKKIPAWDQNNPVKVYATAGSVKHEIYSGTLDECRRFCQEKNWTHLDKNQFEWNLDMEDTRDLPLGYFNAVVHFSDRAGRDMDNDFAREHATELVYCFEHDKDLLDFDFWTQYESLLGDKLTFDEYMHIDSLYDGDPLELKTEDHKDIALLKQALTDLRSVSMEDAAPSRTAPTLDAMIQTAEDRKAQQEPPSQSTTLHYDMNDTIVTYDNYKGGVNNLTTCRTNPVGKNPYQLTSESVITSGTGDTEEIMRRHKSKLTKINKQMEQQSKKEPER